MGFRDESEKRKRSIHKKYNRRLIRLSLAVDEFLKHAEMKLDSSVFEKIPNREQVMQLADKCRELSTLIPDIQELIVDRLPVRETFSEVFQNVPGAPKRIFSENDVFRNLKKIRVGGSEVDTNE